MNVWEMLITNHTSVQYISIVSVYQTWYTDRVLTLNIKQLGNEQKRGIIMDNKKLDRNTLKFAIQISQQFEILCKTTKQGMAEAGAYKTVQEVLQRYLKEIDNENSCINWEELMSRLER